MAEQPKTQRCENCFYYQKKHEEWDGGRLLLRDSTPVCKRYPIANDPGAERRFCRALDWCGEWLPADPETIEEGAAVIARLYLLGDKTAAYALIDKLKENRDEGR